MNEKQTWMNQNQTWMNVGRFAKLIGKNVIHPLTNRKIPIIGDEILVDDRLFVYTICYCLFMIIIYYYY